MAKVSVISVQIPPNEALSSAADLESFSLIALEMPESWQGTQITFQAKAKRTEDLDPPVGSHGGQAVEDWDNVYDSAGNELVVTVAANRIVTDIPELAPLRFVRIRSGTSATPVNQNPAKEIRFIVKE